MVDGEKGSRSQDSVYMTLPANCFLTEEVGHVHEEQKNRGSTDLATAD